MRRWTLDVEYSASSLGLSHSFSKSIGPSTSCLNTLRIILRIHNVHKVIPSLLGALVRQSIRIEPYKVRFSHPSLPLSSTLAPAIPRWTTPSECLLPYPTPSTSSSHLI